ncbi:serine hydrolase domain-containing protein [Streptomyces violaceusniger]|uniref:serine hydrolase domain-containing protein n=1 Tax=Streptomyces violaceusniger TaxID=68280 RepID=UPI00341DE8C4
MALWPTSSHSPRKGGQLDPYAPVAKYWPDFAANGKEHIEVRHLLSHTSGVSGWETPFSTEDTYDWDFATRRLATRRLAAQAPWWEPGTASGYHAQNQGHLVGELVRRVTGKPMEAFVADEIAGPLGADFQIGAGEALALGGTVDGVRLLSPDTIGVIFDEQSHGTDLILDIPLRWGIGFALPESESVPYVPQGRACYWGGWGGSLIVMDLAPAPPSAT